VEDIFKKTSHAHSWLRRTQSHQENAHEDVSTQVSTCITRASLPTQTHYSRNDDSPTNNIK
jgi:hypothetical protein